MRLRTINEAIKDAKSDIVKFLSDKEFKNKRSKSFLYHGTEMPPEKFVLRDDYEGEDGHGWGADLPEGYLFLTTDLGEAKAYGKYIIPCELKRYDHKTIQIDGNNPSQVFDDDYGISIINRTKKRYNFWQKYEESGKSVLIIKGSDKSTIITYTENVIPRTDLAQEFYKSK